MAPKTLWAALLIASAVAAAGGTEPGCSEEHGLNEVLLLQQHSSLVAPLGEPAQPAGGQLPLPQTPALPVGASKAVAAGKHGRRSPWGGPTDLLLPLGGTVLLYGILLWLFKEHRKGCCAAQGARSSFVLLKGLAGVHFSIVILDSYDVCSALGYSKAMSGQMVGVYMITSCLGTVIGWLWLRLRPELWKELPRVPLVFGGMCQLVGAVIYCAVAAEATLITRQGADYNGWAAQLFGESYGRWLFALLMIARGIAGITAGSNDQFNMTSSLHITPVGARMEHTSRFVFSVMLAYGAGPLMAAALRALDLSHVGFVLVGYCQLLTAFASLLVTWSIPELKHVEDCLEKSSSGSGQYGSAAVVTGAIAVGGMRNLGIAACEVGLALEWEDLFQWDQRLTGLVVGLVFLVCIPIKILHSALGHRMATLRWIYLLGGLAAAGSLLLFTPARWFFKGHGALPLVASGALTFPCLYLSDALVASLLYQHVLPEGSLLDANYTQLWYLLWTGLLRYLGCWLARLTLQRCGADAFALQQLAITGLFLLVFRFWVQPFISPKVLELTKQHQRGTEGKAKASRAEGLLKNGKA